MNTGKFNAGDNPRGNRRKAPVSVKMKREQTKANGEPKIGGCLFENFSLQKICITRTQHISLIKLKTKIGLGTFNRTQI